MLNKSQIWFHTHLSLVKVILVLTSICSITACVSLEDPETSQDIHNEAIGILGKDSSVGQTFVSRRSRLSGVILWLKTSENSGPITFEVLTSDSGSPPHFITKFVPEEGENRIEIPPQTDLPGQEYYIRLSNSSGGTSVLGRTENNYHEGSAYVDNNPVPGDIYFTATYDYDWKALVQDLIGLIGSWKIHLQIFILIVVPGWILLEVTNLQKHLDPGELISASTGISLALIPMTMLWTTILKIQWSSLAVKIITIVLLLVSLLLIFQKIKRKPYKNIYPSLPSFIQSPITHLFIIFLITYFIRFAMIRDLTMPSWVDSIHHSIITKAIVNYGGFPGNYLPLIPKEGSYYHSGFHSIIAAFHWITDLEIPEIMLISGQTLNALLIFGVYAISKTVIGDRGSSVCAALITGLFSTMPAYYASWGRYTQLAGLLVLPIAFIAIKQTHNNSTQKSRWILVGTITIGGLFLIHYRVTIFLVFLIGAYWTASLYRYNKTTFQKLKKSILITIIIGLSAIILILLWLIPTIQSFAFPLGSQWFKGRDYIQELHWNYFSPVYGIPILILAGLGLLMGIYKRKRFSIILMVWVLLLFVTANSGYFRIPFPAGFINQSSVEIIQFIPISIFAGFFIKYTWDWMDNKLPSKWKKIWRYFSILCFILAALFGARKMLPILNPNTILFRNSDYDSIKWIQENIPLDEAIVINPTGWGYGLYMGRDGGYWISPITGHQTIPPNVLYGLNKQNRDSVNTFVETLLPIGKEPDRIWTHCREYNYKYIFIGAKGGIFSPETLIESPLFELMNQQQNNWVFKLVDIQ